jgi:hypothetical protein
VNLAEDGGEALFVHSCCRWSLELRGQAKAF